MHEILARLGEGAFGREVLAEALGHANARGGPGARKIAALAQYGLLRRRAGLYSPTRLARRVVAPGDENELLAALRLALRRPPLFEALLDRFVPQGRVPRRLAAVLWRDHGITRKASQAAAETFTSSARYAGVMDGEGAFLIADGDRPEPAAAPTAPRSPAPPTEQRFELALSGGVARLYLPLRLRRKDLEIVRRQLELLEYQVDEEE